MIGDRENARKVVQILMDNPDLCYACDTEVADIDVTVSGLFPCRGLVPCFACRSGCAISKSVGKCASPLIYTETYYSFNVGAVYWNNTPPHTQTLNSAFCFHWE